jgi:hypothetical protein
MKRIHLIVKFHEGGFFSNFNKVATFLNNTTDKVVKITWDLQGQPYGAFAYSCGEVFGKLFLEYNTGESIDIEQTLSEFTDTSFTGREVHDKYTQSEWRKTFNNTLKYFIPTPFLQTAIDKINNNFVFQSPVIGILKRNELLKCEQLNNKMPTLEDYYSIIDQRINDETYLYLAVDNQYDLNEFIKRYHKCIYNPKIRRSNFCYDREPHFTPGTAEDALYTYLEVYALAKCQALIHPLSNMSTAALYFNPNLTSIYI